MAVIKEDNGDAGVGPETTYTLSLGDVFQGTLNPVDDKDWLKVELSAGTIYDFTLSGVDSAELALFDSSGNWIVSGNYTPSGTKLIFSPDTGGTYYIRAGSYNNSFTGDYELALVENTIPVGTYDEIAEYLTDGFWKWSGGTRHAFDVEPGGVLTANITALTEEGQQLAKWALESWTNVTGINFEFVDREDAHIVFDDDNHPDPDVGGGWAHYTAADGVIVSSSVNYQLRELIKFGATVDSRAFISYIHEIGHALGLGHSGPYDGRPFYFGYHNIFLNDSEQTTVMSYAERHINTYLSASYAAPVTPMIADIIAIQNLYGVPDTINTGDTIYGYQSNLDGYLGEFFKLWSGETNPFFGITAPSDLVYQALKPALADLDSDGDPDLVLGNNTGLLYYFENTGTPADPDFTERVGAASPVDGLSVGSYSAPTFVDLDGDSDMDLIVGNGYGSIAYFENTGTASAPGFTQRSGAANPFDGIAVGTRSTLILVDLDSDGDQDLTVGTNDGHVSYYENTGTEINPEFTLQTGESSPLSGIDAGPYNSPAFVDVDGDNDYDLVVGNNRGDILYFENTGTTTAPGFTPRTDFDNPFAGAVAGYWIGLGFADINDDGRPDLVVGNDDGIIHHFENAGTPESPGFAPQSLGPTAFTIYDNGGNDTLDLRTDTTDQRIYLRPESISDVYGLTGNVIIARDTWIENVVAGSGNDVIVGNAVANHISGQDGDDTLDGGPGADRLDGGPGSDTASYQHSAAAVLVRLYNPSAVRLGDAQGDTLVNIEHLVGSAHNDILAGDGEDNVLRGGGGHDDLYGGPAGGDDEMYGDAGDDRLFGGRGNDTLTGGEGNDLLKGGPGEDILIADGDDMDVLYGGPGSDTFRFSPSDLGGGTIRDFSDGEDVIDLTQFTGISSMDDLDIVSHGDNVRIKLTGTDYLTTIILSDFDMSNLDATDFLF